MPSSRRGAAFAYSGPDEAAYPINIVCINGDGIPVFAREAGRSFFAERYTIALWWWEVGDPPAGWSEAYRFLDEVWVGSQHIYDAIAPTSPVPVVRITLPVLEPEVASRTRGQLGLPAGLSLPLPARLPLGRGAQEPAGADRGLPPGLRAR